MKINYNNLNQKIIILINLFAKKLEIYPTSTRNIILVQILKFGQYSLYVVLIFRILINY